MNADERRFLDLPAAMRSRRSLPPAKILRFSNTVRLLRNGFGPYALFNRDGNCRYGNLAQSGDYISTAATNAGRLAIGKIALARGWLQSETKGFMFHLLGCLSDS